MIFYITGFTGSGKSTIGKALAEELGIPFRDLDELIEEHAAKSVELLFQEDGEEQFRVLERQLLSRLHTQIKEPTVIALGGGTLSSEENLNTVLQTGICIYLHRPLSYFLEEALTELKKRPLFSGTSDEAAKKRIEQKYTERLSNYRKAQLQTLVNSGFSPKKLANMLKLLTNRPQSL